MAPETVELLAAGLVWMGLIKEKKPIVEKESKKFADLVRKIDGPSTR